MSRTALSKVKRLFKTDSFLFLYKFFNSSAKVSIVPLRLSALIAGLRAFITVFLSPSTVAAFPALKEFRTYIQSQESKGNLPPKIDSRLVQSIIDSKQCAVCGHHLDTEHLQHVLSILHKLEVSSTTSAELNRASSALNAIIDSMKAYPKKKQAIIDQKKYLDFYVLQDYNHNI